MYCVKCGVELADGEKQCPLCGTRVYHPDIQTNEAFPPYPRGESTPLTLKQRRFSTLPV